MAFGLHLKVRQFHALYAIASRGGMHHQTAKQRTTSCITKSTRRLIVDTDVAFDDLVALSTLLVDRRRINNNNNNDDKHDFTTTSNDNDILVTTVDGGNSARGGYNGLKRLWPTLNVVQGGLSSSHDDDDATTEEEKDLIPPLEPWVVDFRSRFSAFCNRWCDDDDQGDDVATSSSQLRLQRPTSKAACSSKAAVKQYLCNTPDGESVDLICLGPLTNVAQWMTTDLEELMLQKVGSIWILGGNIHSEDDEFNFGQDPTAAASILHHARLRERGIQIYLVPGDETSGGDDDRVVDDNEAYIMVDTVLQVARACSQKNLIAQLLMEEPRFAMFFDPVLVFLYQNHQQILPLDNYDDDDDANNDDDAVVVEWVPRDVVINSETGQVQVVASAGTSVAGLSITPCLVARRVDFLAYQNWLLQCLRKGEPRADYEEHC